MNKEELTAFLKEHMTLDITILPAWNSHGRGNQLNIKIKIDDEVIAEDFEFIND